jgi:hypothetical protein
MCLWAQNAPVPEAPAGKGLPPRTGPADYQAQAKAGAVIIAADFEQHSLPTLEGSPLTNENYVVVEVALFGQPGARLQLSPNDFSLRINGRKTPQPAQPYGLVVHDVKDPEWQPPEPRGPKASKSAISTGGDSAAGEPAPSPTPVKIPVEVQRGWALRVQKATLPEGDRALPVAGALYFDFRAKANKIHSVELIYAGPAGKATLALQP